MQLQSTSSCYKQTSHNHTLLFRVCDQVCVCVRLICVLTCVMWSACVSACIVLSCREARSLQVMLCVSDSRTREGVPHNMYLLQRWFPLMLAVTGGRSWQQL